MKHAKHQQGTSMIEILVTLLLLSSGLLAMASLQTRSLKFNEGSFVRSQANIYAYEIIDRMRVGRGADSKNITDYNIGYGDEVVGESVVQLDLFDWKKNLADNLPEGDGAITCVKATRICTVSIKWSEALIYTDKAQAGGEESPDASTELVYVTNI